MLQDYWSRGQEGRLGPGGFSLAHSGFYGNLPILGVLALSGFAFTSWWEGIAETGANEQVQDRSPVGLQNFSLARKLQASDIFTAGVAVTPTLGLASIPGVQR